MQPQACALGRLTALRRLWLVPPMGKAGPSSFGGEYRTVGPRPARNFEHPAFSANLDFRFSGERSGGSGPADGPGMPRMHPADRLARVRKLAEA